MIKSILVALTAVGGMCWATAWGVTPSTPPAIVAATSYSGSGTLISISPTKLSMNISGNDYRFTEALRVYSADGKPLTMEHLQPGQSVTYSADASLSPKRPYIKDIRVLGGPAKER